MSLFLRTATIALIILITIIIIIELEDYYRH